MADAFDYIIVGAGSAGCVLAARLSEDPSVTVALLEAGGRDDSMLIKMPAGVGNLIKEKCPQNWGFETAPQAHMDGRKLWWPRGKGWGGSSSINGMIYIRGHARDYDQWRQMGLAGWAYRDVLPYFRKAEHLESGEDSWHGEDGPLWVSHPKSGHPLYRAFVQAGKQAGYPYTKDFNGRQQEGFGPYQLTIKEGERWSASYAYLRPIAGKRPNLNIISNAQAKRIVMEGKKAVGVAYAAAPGAAEQIVRARKEVIVCTGAVQSPQLLMLSGIGPAAHLQAMGVPVVHDSPDVGANLQDHLDVCIINECTQPITAWSFTKGLRQLVVGMNYAFRGQGPGRFNYLESGAFLKTRTGLDRPDIQLHFVIAMMVDHARTRVEKDGFTVHACQLRPESRGTVRLSSADPFAAPVIDPRYLEAERDRETMRDAVRLVRKVIAQPAFDPYRGPEFAPGAHVQSDADIDGFIRTKGETIYHPVGTCRMGVDDKAVLDGALKVRGVDGLRVVDASSMPTLVGGNTNAPTIMVAEKAADMILGRAALPAEDAPIAEDESQAA
jgi:choline dehydrogenase